MSDSEGRIGAGQDNYGFFGKFAQAIIRVLKDSHLYLVDARHHCSRRHQHGCVPQVPQEFGGDLGALGPVSGADRGGRPSQGAQVQRAIHRFVFRASLDR